MRLEPHSPDERTVRDDTAQPGCPIEGRTKVKKLTRQQQQGDEAGIAGMRGENRSQQEVRLKGGYQRWAVKRFFRLRR
jgi:hypothetical protein